MARGPASLKKEHRAQSKMYTNTHIQAPTSTHRDRGGFVIQLDSHMEDVDKGLAIYRKECYPRLCMYVCECCFGIGY